MANIQRRTDKTGKTTFRVQVRLKGHPAQTASFERLTDARKWAASTESAIHEGRHFPHSKAKKTTLSDVLERYLHESVPTKSTSQQRNQELHIKFWREKLGFKVLADITDEDIAALRDELATGTYRRKDGPGAKEYPRSAGATNRYLFTLRHVFNMAIKWKLIKSNPAALVAKCPEPKERVRFLDDDERRRLLEACKASHNKDLYTVVVLALSTGARRMEIWGLRWADVDLKRGRVVFHETKNGSRRGVPLQGHALELMKARAKVRRIDSDLVFPSPSDPSKPFDFRRPFEMAVEAAGIENFRYHDLRHSTASYLVMNGCTLAEAAEVLGHKSLLSTARYAHLSDGHVTKLVERMNAAVFDDVAGTPQG